MFRISISTEIEIAGRNFSRTFCNKTPDQTFSPNCNVSQVTFTLLIDLTFFAMLSKKFQDSYKPVLTIMTLN